MFTLKYENHIDLETSLFFDKKLSQSWKILDCNLTDVFCLQITPWNTEFIICSKREQDWNEPFSPFALIRFNYLKLNIFP